jgi:hypothetical protein
LSARPSCKLLIEFPLPNNIVELLSNIVMGDGVCYVLSVYIYSVWLLYTALKDSLRYVLQPSVNKSWANFV